MYLFYGICLLVVSAVTYTAMYKIGRHFDRAQFERRNDAGVEVFSDYDAKEKARLKEYGAKGLIFILFWIFLPSIVAGAFMIFYHFTQ